MYLPVGFKGLKLKLHTSGELCSVDLSRENCGDVKWIELAQVTSNGVLLYQ
jgi:hypothetical protein